MKIKTYHFLVIISILFFYSCTNAQEKKEYYENGKIKTITEYKDELKSGKEKTYYPNGELSDIFTYKDGIKNGPYSVYHENGNLHKTGFIKNGHLDGLYIELCEVGDTLFKIEYLNGKTQYDIRYENNKPLRIMDFRKQQMIVYNPDGTVKDIVPIKKR